MNMELAPPPTEAPPPAAPPALPYATARADRPGRGFIIALAAHLALIGGVLLVLHERALRPPPPPTTVALVIEKPPPPAPKPPAPKPPAPPATPPQKAPAAPLPMPPPPPPQPAKMPKPAAPHLAKARPAPPQPAKTAAQTPGTQGLAHTPTTAPPRPAAGNPPPVYPYIAREQGDEGWVNLSVHVTANGEPDAAVIIESSGHLLLDDEARQNVLQHWHFQPAVQNGQPVASTIDLWFHFDLKDASP
jgi:protein TonB